jgi:arginase family enzyme
LHVVGFDTVEVPPAFDNAQTMALLAATLVFSSSSHSQPWTERNDVVLA